MRALRVALLLVLAIVALNQISYGLFFILDPQAGSKEFGEASPDPASEAETALVSVVGTALLGGAGACVLAAYWVLRRNRAGLTLCLALASFFALLGVVSLLRLTPVDAVIYGAFAVGLGLPAGALVALEAKLKKASP